MLRISSGRASTQIVLLPLVARFLQAYPEIRVEIVDMVAMPSGPAMRSVVVGAAAFFATHPVPRHPQDLLGLPCIRHRFPGGLVYRWEFEQAGVKFETQVDGPLTLGDVGLMTTRLRGDGPGSAWRRPPGPGAGRLVSTSSGPVPLLPATACLD